MERRQTFSERFDWTLCLIIFLFFIISCIIIASAQTNNPEINYVVKQIQWYIIGIFLIAFIMYFDPDQIKRMTWYLYGFGLLLLLMLAIIPGSEDNDSFVLIRNGAKSWFQLPGIGQLQPSEFMKIFLILALSRVATQHNQFTPTKTLKTDLFLLLKLGTLTIIPLGFIAKQPDLGTSLVIISIFLGIVLISGISWKILMPAFSTVAAIGVFLIYMVLKFPDFLQEHFNYFDPYQFKRIYSWLEPEKYAGSASYQLLQSLKAIGSGMMEGKGFNERVVFIPEVHTDFIFSVIGEEWGFIGGSFIIGLYFVLIYHLTKIALNTTDSFNSYICGGVISMITFHVLENIGMTIQLLPITGIPLPFISYGGSALMTNMMAMGLIFSIHLHHKTYMFSSRDRIPIPKNNRKIAH